MFNCFLHTAFLVNADVQALEKSMIELNEVQLCHTDGFDHFFKESNLSMLLHTCGISVMKTLFERLPNRQLSFQVLPVILERMETVGAVNDDIAVVNRAYPSRKNCFWTADFPPHQIYKPSTQATYAAFRQNAIDNVSISDFWMMHHFLFPHIQFCPQTQRQVEKVTDVNSFKGLLGCFSRLDDYASHWTKDDFDMGALSATVDASYESKETMKEFGKQRRFKISNEIGSKECSPHLKYDHLRAHFYPDNVGHKIYVAYIGPHLKTHKYR